MIFSIITLILILIAAGILVIRLIFTVKMYHHETPIIKSADNNISTTKLGAIGAKLKERLGLHEWSIEMGTDETYYGIANNINKKAKLISIAKFNMVSVGYEIDNLLGNIWFAAKIIHRDKRAKRFLLFVNFLIPFFNILFYLTSLLQIALWFLNQYQKMTVINSDFLYFLKQNHILFFIAMVFLLISATFQVFVYGSKDNLEQIYEREISSFVAKECHEYAQDVVAARTYALSWKTILMPVFARKVSNLKYLGPFVIYK